MTNVKIQEGSWVKTEGLSDEVYKKVVQAFIKAGAKASFKYFSFRNTDFKFALKFDKGDLNAYRSLNEDDLPVVDELTVEQVLSTLEDEQLEQPEYPKPPFKLSCGDKPEVRQWLKDQGYTWCNGEELTSYQTDKAYLYVTNEFSNDFKVTYDELIEDFNASSKPEVSPEFTTETRTTVTWTVEETQKECNKKLDPEVVRKLEYIQSNIEAMQEEIEFIKSKYK